MNWQRNDSGHSKDCMPTMLMPASGAFAEHAINNLGRDQIIRKENSSKQSVEERYMGNRICSPLSLGMKMYLLCDGYRCDHAKSMGDSIWKRLPSSVKDGKDDKKSNSSLVLHFLWVSKRSFDGTYFGCISGQGIGSGFPDLLQRSFRIDPFFHLA